MTPENNTTAAAIDRNTAAIQSHRDWTFAAVMLLVLLLVAISGKATPISIAYEIGYPPEIGQPLSSPPNPNLQYWYTADIPGPQGVLPQEVYAPRLVGVIATNPQGANNPQGVDTPEPGTWWLVGFVSIMAACVMVLKEPK